MPMILANPKKAKDEKRNVLQKKWKKFSFQKWPKFRTLNLWIHPSMEQQLLSEIAKLSNVQIVTATQMDMQPMVEETEDPSKPIKVKSGQKKFFFIF